MNYKNTLLGIVGAATIALSGCSRDTKETAFYNGDASIFTEQQLQQAKKALQVEDISKLDCKQTQFSSTIHYECEFSTDKGAVILKTAHNSDGSTRWANYKSAEANYSFEQMKDKLMINLYKPQEQHIKKGDPQYSSMEPRARARMQELGTVMNAVRGNLYNKNLDSVFGK